MKKIFFLSLVLVSYIFADIKLNEKPNELILHDDLGGRVDGSPFSTKEIVGKVYYLVYVDPDEKGLNDEINEAIKAKKFDKTNFGSIAIINLAATWLPNFAIETMLKKKQEEFPNTIYLKDKKKFFVEKWGLKDDSFNILIFDKQGVLLYKVAGKATQEDIKNIISLIEQNL